MHINICKRTKILFLGLYRFRLGSGVGELGACRRQFFAFFVDDEGGCEKETQRCALVVGREFEGEF